MSLVDGGVGRKVRIVRHRGGRRLAATLAGLGLHPGVEVTVVGGAPFNGPIMLEVTDTGARLALGRGMAEKIDVAHAYQVALTEPEDDALRKPTPGALH